MTRKWSKRRELNLILEMVLRLDYSLARELNLILELVSCFDYFLARELILILEMVLLILILNVLLTKKGTFLAV